MSTNMNGAELQPGHFDSVVVQRIAERVFQNYSGGFGVRLWDGNTLSLGRDRPAATVVVHSARLLRALVWQRDPLRLAAGYFSGELDVEGDLFALLAQKAHLRSLELSLRDRVALLGAALSLRDDAASIRRDTASDQRSMPLPARVSRRHSKSRDANAIAFHYDVSNEFYRLWLDREMIYSCAYFNDPGESLDQAQRNKLDHICRKLRLKAGERFLDIGCGWGALICWAAQHYSVHAHGITLSRQQFEFAQRKICALGLENQVTIELRDYRDLPEGATFDKVSSVGMFEHVGLKNLPAYFGAVYRVLKPGGLFMNHGITDNDLSGNKSVGSEFMQRYVFPDGELDSVSSVQRVMERSGFEIRDVEALRPHYALTLRHWVSRLEARKTEARAHVSEATYRVWRLYMAACALQFESGAIGVYQILAGKGHEGFVDVPLTRRDIYQ